MTAVALIKDGTKIKNLRLVAGYHEVDCKSERVSFMLKASCLMKV
jgi:uncharacterized Zn ribbon protein